LISALPINPGKAAAGPHWGSLDNLERGDDGYYHETDEPKRLATADYFVARTSLDGDHKVCMVDIDEDASSAWTARSRMSRPVSRASASTGRPGRTGRSATPSRTPCSSLRLMTTPSDTTRRRHSPKWRRRGPAGSPVTVPTGANVAGGRSGGAARRTAFLRGTAGLVVAALGVAALVWLGGGRQGTNPVLALVDPSPSGPGPALRVILLVATVATSGIGLVRALLGLSDPGDRPAPLPDGVRRLAWVGGLASAAACVAEVLTGQSSRPLGALQLAVSLLVPLLLGAPRAVALPALALAGLLATELGTVRAGLPLALDVAYALAGAVLLGASVFGVSHPGAVGSNAVRRNPAGRNRVGRNAVGRIAVPAGLVTSVAGVAQLLLTGRARGTTRCTPGTAWRR